MATLLTASVPKSLRPLPGNRRIIGGVNATIETYPYQVSLQENGTHVCGGSIISARYVLTAAHCVEPEVSPPEAYTVRAGSSYTRRGGSVHEVERVLRHERYYDNYYGTPVNDVALVRVKQPFRFGKSRRPIVLYGRNDKVVPGELSVVTGWGDTDARSDELADRLQAVTVPIIDRKICRRAYRKRDGGLPAGQICAGYYGVGGKDHCNGDSGGPLVVNGHLAGIVSWGKGCGGTYFPGVYTEVAYFRDWIDRHARF